MGFNVDFSGVKEPGKSNTVPKGVYLLKVTEPKQGEIRSGDNAGRPKVDMKIVVASGPEAGKWCFHTVSFLDPEASGAGFAKHFLKVIGQPYEGKVNVSPPAWDGKTFKGLLGYKVTESKGKEYVNNVLEDSWAKDDDSVELGQQDSEVPSVDEMKRKRSKSQQRLERPAGTVSDASEEEVPF
jgi:hypothetical protein